MSPPRRRRPDTGSSRGMVAVLCVMAALVGVAMGHAQGVGWLTERVPDVDLTALPWPRGDAGAGAASGGVTTGPGDATTAPGGATEGTTASAEPPPAPVPPRRRTGRPITISAVGDTMLGTPRYGLPPDDGRGIFADVRDLIRADIALVNLEGTLSTTTASKCPPVPAPDADEEEKRRFNRCFAFQSPPGYGRLLRAAGFTVANLANNHSSDFGAAGRDETLAALEDAGLRATGLVGQTARVRAKGNRVAVLGFAPYEWADPLLDIPAAAARVTAATAEADIVMVTFHGGAEGPEADRVPEGEETHLGERRGDLRAFSRAVVDAGADLVVGHGPHVLRGMEVYRGRLIAYSLGNFLGYRAFNVAGPLGESMVLRVTLGPKGALRRARILPVSLDRDGVPAPGGTAIATVRGLSQEDFPDSAPRIGDDGLVLPPARLAPGAGGSRPQPSAGATG